MPALLFAALTALLLATAAAGGGDFPPPAQPPASIGVDRAALLPTCYNTCCEAATCGTAAFKAGQCPNGTQEHLETCADPCCISEAGSCCRLGLPPG